MKKNDYSYFGQGDCGYEHYMLAFKRSTGRANDPDDYEEDMNQVFEDNFDRDLDFEDE